ncbi:hypothetical protein FVEG_16804 [Fusarium verticillioides 7600]|uniref:Uncharacterized protein n=1 Tax=Gibberella moniliformis (strain M3125 / FGSC 7600) TaxID=334819 RepID=W7MUS2_GIBM7|nr:hypothetical protein FVEG_16804 [Fusarium verticillioides 7600]XP_018757706.1 hypothetical protein FVEG_16804 [Fusarium verticillioides 7600]XP_018757707.1 hypothetical protein FVEG_16804 [Fusarium verticillioides 7600]EWG51514.1 hypothetical protein FVEG_16804 [Fusarium verticillioides 7600]EWG51515.1 hypothetical protein FVEG_16804 [Fusarium verticillioides 7600]EWG51516.1 hypothetical protein FVEG_16804 [Fusarium verticillioides 7600]
MSDIRAKTMAHPRYARVYARATQLTSSRTSKSTPILCRLVATIEVSVIERNRPRRTLGVCVSSRSSQEMMGHTQHRGPRNEHGGYQGLRFRRSLKREVMSLFGSQRWLLGCHGPGRMYPYLLLLHP